MSKNPTVTRAFTDTTELLPKSDVSLRSSFGEGFIDAYRIQHHYRKLDPFTLEKHTVVIFLGVPSYQGIRVGG